MRRITQPSRRRTRIESDYARELESIRNETLRALRKEANDLLKEWKNELQASLREDMRRSTQSVSSPRESENPQALDFSSFSRVLGSYIRLQLSKPRFTQESQETQRSQQLRLGRQQQIAEIAQQLARGERNQ